MQGLQKIAGRIGDVERHVSSKLDSALDMVKTLNQRQQQQGEAMEEREQKRSAQEAEIQNVLMRIERLEQKGTGDAGLGSLSLAEMGAGMDRGPALIIGGWAEDQEADKTMALARNLLAKAAPEISMKGMFVPGIRRGFAIIPWEPQSGKDQKPQCQKMMLTIAHIRNTVRLDPPRGHCAGN